MVVVVVVAAAVAVSADIYSEMLMVHFKDKFRSKD